MFVLAGLATNAAFAETTSHVTSKVSLIVKPSPTLVDQTVIQGVNTAGVIRVNHLAELEQALNIAVNCLEVVLPILGVYFVYRTIKNGKGTARSKRIRGYAIGAALILSGLMMPGMLNLFVASGCGSLFSGTPKFQ